MALVIEDGSVVEGADSCISLADARIQAANRGLTLSDDDTTAKSQLRQGYFWLVDTYEARLQGARVSAIQTGCVPRTNMTVRGFEVASDTIPAEFITAQVSMAASIQAGVDTNATQSGSDLKSFNVDGVYSESYKDSGHNYVLASTPAITNMLKPYMANGGKIGLYREDMRITNGWC